MLKRSERIASWPYLDFEDPRTDGKNALLETDVADDMNNVWNSTMGGSKDMIITELVACSVSGRLLF